MRNLCSFETPMTHAFIHVVYWLGIAVTALAGAGLILAGSNIKGVLIIVAGPIVVRVGREVLIVLFHINEHLAVIRAARNI